MNIPIGKIIIALLIVMAVIIVLSLSDNPMIFAGLILLIMGGLGFCIAHIILVIDAFAQSMATGLLFTFVPFYDMFFACRQYQGGHKIAVLTCWYGGAFVAVIGSLIWIWALF